MFCTKQKKINKKKKDKRVEKHASLLLCGGYCSLNFISCVGCCWLVDGWYFVCCFFVVSASFYYCWFWWCSHHHHTIRPTVRLLKLGDLLTTVVYLLYSIRLLKLNKIIILSDTHCFGCWLYLCTQNYAYIPNRKKILIFLKWNRKYILLIS